MDGFLTDYISTFMAEFGRQPTYEEYAQYMTGYTPEQMPVVSGLARGFATFDHWFCDVPSCTFPNRSFFHAGTSSGYVVNMSPPESFIAHNDAETLFDRLEAHGLTWKVYCDPPSHYSLTGLIHAPRLRDRFATHFFSTDQFFEDTEKGELPTYSFIEPQIIGHAHNDMHPAFGMLTPGLTWDPPSSLIGGEDLLARLYNAIRSSSSSTGSNYLNTTLLVTFDEHGGTYDHVVPPPAVPPDPTAQAGQFGFTFNRSGVRIPTLAISAWIPERTVLTEEYRATSLIATMRERWDLGEPFTQRDASARSFNSIFTLDKPREQADWPDIFARPVEPMPEPLMPLSAPLNGLGKAPLRRSDGAGQADGSRRTRPGTRRPHQRRASHRHDPRHVRRPLPRHASLTQTVQHPAPQRDAGAALRQPGPQGPPGRWRFGNRDVAHGGVRKSLLSQGPMARSLAR